MSTLPADDHSRIPRRVHFLVRTDDPMFSVSANAARRLTLAEMQRTPVSAYDASSKVLAPVSANGASSSPVFPPRERRTDEGTLWRFSTLATRARTAGRSRRKILRFPALRPVYAKNRYGPDGNLTRRGSSYNGDIWRYLTTWGYRTLNDLDSAGFAPPTHDDLTALFERRVRERGKTFYPLYSNRGHGISLADVETMADAAAAAVLRDWSPDWIREMTERGRTGGKNSPGPGPLWTADDLDKLAALDGRTVAQQASALGVSMSTIDRMRRALRQRY